jgi:ribosomal protein S14
MLSNKYKDKFLREKYKRFEIWNLLNKSLKKSYNFYNIIVPIKSNKRYSRVSIRNYCFETGRSKGVVTFFRFSRMLIRKKAGMGLLSGIYK